MWIYTPIWVLYCCAIVVCREKQVTSRNNVLLKENLAEDSNYSGRNRAKRTPSRGSYCRLRGCCPGRDDDCTIQYHERNAICYCDDFCMSDPPGSADCCPDFWTACHRLPLRQLVPPHMRTPPATHCELLICLQQWSHLASCSSKCVKSQWECSDETCLIRPSLIQQINDGNYGWKASNYSKFWGMRLKEGFEYRLGTFPPSAALLDMRPLTASTRTETDFPEFFVSWYEWPGWIHDPLDQRNCAASWAFSTASVAADRIAIHSKGLFTDNLSPQHLISCDTKNQHGCKGGSINGAWSYLKKYGLVSHTCYPFFWNQSHQAPCAISSVFDADGKRRATRPCPNDFEPTSRIYQCHSPYRISSQETEIMKEIKENGPVQAVMQVYDDFFLYKSGIYKHRRSTAALPRQDDLSRTHSVKIIGGQWIAANSWGNSWGENGYFRILRGQNECDIEQLVVAWGLSAE
uniref:Tubulointerstitial nephritis antigen n=1 Tax=Varanus komodoensis TaxID=61221 RepID=A0A8D2IQD9_VARKO